MKHIKKKFVPVNIKTDPKKNRIIVTRAVRYKDVLVPKGYSSDGLTKLVNKWQPKCLRGALVHDAVCDGTLSTVTGMRVTRKAGDRYFREILELDGVGWFQRNRYYWAVSAFRIATFKK